ncbi:hypothetical protein LX32DRAFT_104451 [Colletotrichum zoysiae]|uniref:Uncharacterized protein n=1 Tax=Colletotrichum zoysiae TaxID=1216348 RepID=A0AAD9HRR7_9PEZI|nr:hypothetical protein LX32DRAFT_104451 [Colletotrichum zoysiae]
MKGNGRRMADLRFAAVLQLLRNHLSQATVNRLTTLATVGRYCLSTMHAATLSFAPLPDRLQPIAASVGFEPPAPQTLRRTVVSCRPLPNLQYIPISRARSSHQPLWLLVRYP